MTRFCFVDNSYGLIADKNISSDTTAPGTTTLHNVVAADEWIAPGTNFHLKATAQARGFAEIVPAEYNTDFDGTVRS